MKCPRCGREGATLVALANQNYPASFRCYNGSAHQWGEYAFGADDEGVDRREAATMENQARSLSQENAIAFRQKRRG